MNHAGADSTCPQITDVSIPNFGTEVKSAVKTLNIAHDVRVAVRVAPMSTSEDIPLHFQFKEKEDGNDTRRTELEHGDTTNNKHGTMPSVKGSAGAAAPAATTRWKTVMITVTTLLAYMFLNAGISMIGPFYPIEVSYYYQVHVQERERFNHCLIQLLD